MDASKSFAWAAARATISDGSSSSRGAAGIVGDGGGKVSSRGEAGIVGDGGGEVKTGKAARSDSSSGAGEHDRLRPGWSRGGSSSSSMCGSWEGPEIERGV
jgi:hypothetical protein